MKAIKNSIVSALFLLPVFSFAQTSSLTNLNEQSMFLTDVRTGLPIRLASNIDVTGSPYFNKEFCTANIKLQKGRKYHGVNVKVNLQDNKLLFKAPDGQELEPLLPIELIEIVQCEKEGKTAIFRSGYPATGRQSASAFYQLLDSGKVQLLKYWNVDFMDSRPYGTGNIQRTYEASPIYYAYSAEKGMVALGKGNESAILQVLSDKKEEINKFISSQNIRLKREEDMTKVFSFYNNGK